jgi:hypothetical protein
MGCMPSLGSVTSLQAATADGAVVPACSEPVVLGRVVVAARWAAAGDEVPGVDVELVGVAHEAATRARAMTTAPRRNRESRS